ncbi:MAG: hypothetical protein QM796_08085 [Chthoniobacteraceae bacterium]
MIPSCLLPSLTLTTMPPKESGTWVDGVFDRCVDLLLWGAAQLGTSYNAINVWVFCVIWPLFTLLLIGVIIYQHRRIRYLTRYSRLSR